MFNNLHFIALIRYFTLNPLAQLSWNVQLLTIFKSAHMPSSYSLLWKYILSMPQFTFGKLFIYRTNVFCILLQKIIMKTISNKCHILDDRWSLLSHYRLTNVNWGILHWKSGILLIRSKCINKHIWLKIQWPINGRFGPVPQPDFHSYGFWIQWATCEIEPLNKSLMLCVCLIRTC